MLKYMENGTRFLKNKVSLHTHTQKDNIHRAHNGAWLVASPQGRSHYYYDPRTVTQAWEPLSHLLAPFLFSLSHWFQSLVSSLVYVNRWTRSLPPNLKSSHHPWPPLLNHRSVHGCSSSEAKSVCPPDYKQGLNSSTCHPKPSEMRLHLDSLARCL